MLAGRGGALAYALADGEIGLLSAKGRLLWAGLVPQAEKGYFHLDERGVYYLSKRGSAGFTYDGRRLWTIKIDGASSLPALGDEGLLYSGGEDWILYAYRVEERVRSDAASIYGIEPPGNYGLGRDASSFAEKETTSTAETIVAVRLEELERRLSAREVGENEPAFTEELLAIARGGRVGGNVRLSPDAAIPPILRERAVLLLSRFASRETIPFLIDVFNRDDEAFVRAAAAETIGKIGADPGGRAIQAFSEAVFPPKPLRDERVLVAVAASVGSLCRVSGPPLSEAGVGILVALAQDERLPSVRDRARAELQSLTAP